MNDVLFDQMLAKQDTAEAEEFTAPLLASDPPPETQLTWLDVEPSNPCIAMSLIEIYGHVPWKISLSKWWERQEYLAKRKKSYHRRIHAPLVDARRHTPQLMEVVR